MISANLDPVLSRYLFQIHKLPWQSVQLKAELSMHIQGVCLLKCYLPTWPLCTGDECGAWNPQSELILGGSDWITISSHIWAFVPCFGSSRSDCTSIHTLPPSLSRTSGRLKKLPFVNPHKDCLIVWKSYIECWVSEKRAQVHSRERTLSITGGLLQPGGELWTDWIFLVVTIRHVDESYSLKFSGGHAWNI